MTRRWRHQLSSASDSKRWGGSSSSLTPRSNNRFAAALAKLALPFRRRVRFHEDPGAKAAVSEETDAGIDVLPQAPSFRQPQMDIEQTVQGIADIAELVSTRTNWFSFVEDKLPSVWRARLVLIGQQINNNSLFIIILEAFTCTI